MKNSSPRTPGGHLEQYYPNEDSRQEKSKEENNLEINASHPSTSAVSFGKSYLNNKASCHFGIKTGRLGTSPSGTKTMLRGSWHQRCETRVRPKGNAKQAYEMSTKNSKLLSFGGKKKTN